MHGVNHLVHAYKQAPWRVQRQWIGAFLLGVLGLAMVAALYLDVTAQAAITGRRIQDMTAAMIATRHANADLETKIASLTSASTMAERALALDFRPIEPDEVEYLMVPGYVAPQPAILTAAPELSLKAPSIPPEYTQSLLDWINEQLHAFPSAGLAGGLQ